jgi:hypothetical protein
MSGTLLPEDMQAVIAKLRGELSSKTELEAINYLADKLNMSLMGIRSGELNNDQYAAVFTSTAIVLLIKQMVIQLERASQV